MYFNLTRLVLCFFPVSLLATTGGTMQPDSRFAVPMVYAGDTAFICSGDTLDLATLGAYILDNGAPSTDGLWASSGGSFSPDNTLTNALKFVPDAAQIAAGFAVLRLTSTTTPAQFDEVTVYLHEPGLLACNGAVVVGLSENCSTVIGPQMLLSGVYQHYEFYNVHLSYSNNTPLSPSDVVNASHIGQVIKATVTDICNGNSCWGQLSVVDETPPVVACTDFNIACAQSNVAPAFLFDSLGITSAYPSVFDNCTAFTRSWTDVWMDLPCPSPVVSGNETGNITRTWMVTDAAGNTSSCIQTIHIIGLRGIDVQFPADQQADCTTGPTLRVPYSTFIYPSGIRTYPLWPNSQYCEVQLTFADIQEPVCDGTYSIRRTWTVVDDCLPSSPYPPLINPVDALQVITVSDSSGPFLPCPSSQIYPMPVDQCCAIIDLPDIVISDNCSRINHIDAQVTVIDPITGDNLGIQHIGNNTLASAPTPGDTLGRFGVTSCLPTGTHVVRYTATDDCGNHRSCSFQITLADLTPPVAVCDEWTFVALGLDGITYVNAASFDDGSYDNCADVYFKVRNMDARCQSTSFFFDEAKFCCNQTGDTVQVILRVYDVPPAPGMIVPDTLAGHYNECMVQVVVEDKIKPVCAAPVNTTISCDLFDPALTSYGAPMYTDNNTCCFTTIIGTVSYNQFDTLCNRGTISRNWLVTDCSNNTSTCQQKIYVNYNQNYSIKFPDDKVLSVCNGNANPYSAPSFTGEDCELMATSYVDEIFTVVPDACFKIERTWTVINWCTYTPNTPCTYVNNPDGSTTGATVAAPAGDNCYKYKQIIKIIDTQDPTVVAPAPDAFCDYSGNVATNGDNFWNASYWWDGPIASHNMCEGDADITITATDACSGTNISFRYLLFLDLDGNTTMETVVPGSAVPQVYNEIRYNNINTPNYTGGEPRAFDFRVVPANQKWGWGLTVDAANGNNRTAHIRWVNQAGQNTVPQLPYGTHKIKWFIEDGCGNETTSETTFTVDDCKKPTVVCVNGLSINQMNGPMNTVTLWASDFLVYGEDNCTPSNLLKYGIRVSGTGSGFPMVTGVPQTSVTFGCNDLGTQFVELWAIDLSGNADFCETYVIIQDNTGACSNITMASVAGALKTESTQGVEDVMVQLDGSANGIPMLGEVFTNLSGNYMFSHALPASSNATVTPIMDADPLNGVNTWDLVLISRHILGLEPLNSAYKLIAADANKSGTVTTFDIVELRKMILGTYTELPNNSSWRFVDYDQQFPNPENPFTEVIRENLQIANIQSDFMEGDFVGVKVGDVDGTATPNSLVSSDDRTAGTLLFDVTDRKVVAGETFTVNFKAAEKVAGYQFTMNFNGLEVVDVVPGAGMTTENFGIFADAVTTSVDGTVGIEQGQDFAVTFRAKQAGILSNMLGVSSRITKAVAFTSAALTSTTLGAGDGNQLDVAFRFNNGGVSTIAGLGFELYQNAPNPWINKTVIGFHLPEATAATLTVYDATGRTIYTQKGNFAKGYNSFSLDRSLGGFTSSAAEMYYKVETATDSGVKQMIQVR